METEEEPSTTAQNQNLHDLQNYLVTFKNEIEGSDDVLTNIGVDSSDVNDLYQGSANHDLQDPGEEVSGQFSSGFYSEQGMLGTALSDEPTQQIQSLVTSSKQDDESVTNDIKDNMTVNTIDLDSMQSQMAVAGYSESSLNQSLQSMQSGSAQGIIMTSLEDTLDPVTGKMIQIVSLGGEDGQYLSLTEGQQMQILNSEALGLTSDSLVENMDSSVDLNSSSSSSVMNSSNPQMTLVSLAGNTFSTADTPSNNTGIRIMTPDIKGGAGSPGQIAVVASGAATSDSGVDGNGGASGLFSAASAVPQLVALSGTGDGSQPQLFALHRPGITDSLQMSNLLGSTEGMSQDLACQTITIMPSDLAQAGDMNYVLVLSQQDGSQGNKVASVAQFCDLKHEPNELGNALVDENGIAKNMLRLIPKNDINQPLVCDFCNYTSSKRYLLTRHMKSHSEERPFKCDACLRGFKTPASLLNHVNTHTGTRPHKCKTCEAAFTTSGELVRHIRYRHTFEKPHRCPECDYASVELSKLKRHMRSHTGERPYKCSSCPYASPDTYKLKRHMRIHTGEKPYECEICHARFTQSNSLKAHKLIHSGNKPVYQCSLCPTTCGRKTDLKIHFNKLHAVGFPLDCKKCGKAFSDRYSFKQHMRSHDLDKCFKCDRCDYMAANEKQLEIHSCGHKKKYDCDECQMSFVLKNFLEKHRALFHSNIGKESNGITEEKMKDEPDNGFSDSVLNGKYDIADLPSESEESSNLLSCAPSTSDTLHKNIMQDIKEGKLGDVPQVVIVHPDGSSEEISSKLTGDKWSIEELFWTATNNGQTVRPDEGDKETLVGSISADGGQKQKEFHEVDAMTSPLSSDPNIGDGDTNVASSSTLTQTALDQENNSALKAEGNCAGSSQLCEASTQAEIESDTDSSGETPDHCSNALMEVDDPAKSKELSSGMEANLNVSQGKKQNSKFGPSSASKCVTPKTVISTFSTTTQAQDHQMTATNDSSSVEQISTSSSSSFSSSSITGSNSQSYLKSLIMKKPSVIKSPPNSSLLLSSPSSSISLSSSISSPSKKMTSLFQLPNKPISSLSTNPNLVVKQNSGGQQFSLLKNLDINSSSSSPLISSSSSTLSSSQSLSSSNSTTLPLQSTILSQLISDNTTSGNDSVVKLFSTVFSSSGSRINCNISTNSNFDVVDIGSTQVVTSSLHASESTLNNSNTFSLNENNKTPQIITSAVSMNDSTASSGHNNIESNATTQRVLENETGSISSSQSDKQEFNISASKAQNDQFVNSTNENENVHDKEITSSILPTASPFAPATVAASDSSKMEQHFHHSHPDTEYNSTGKSSSPPSGSFSVLKGTSFATAASENVKTELAALLRSRENDQNPSKASQSTKSADYDESNRKIKVEEVESKHLDVALPDVSILTLEKVVDEESQTKITTDNNVSGSSEEEASGDVTTAQTAVAKPVIINDTQKDDDAKTPSSSKPEQRSTDAGSEVNAVVVVPPPSQSPALNKKGKLNKRHADMDQSLVVPGKRVRKALVKVSL